MANPLPFVPKKADPKTELQKRLAAAPTEHAEALLVAYDLLGEAHEQGLLDMLQGLLRAKDVIAGEVAKYGSDPIAINALRHIIAVGRMVGSFDPEPITSLARDCYGRKSPCGKENEPPSLWQLFRRMSHKDTRRGMAFLTSMLSALGRAVQ